MKLSPCRFAVIGLSVILTLSLIAASALAQNGPDVIVGSLPNVSNYGPIGNIKAFSVGTTSCNIGNLELQWISSTNQHPVIAQNLYRYRNNRFELIGISWLKHGFTALQGSLCTPNCTPSGTGSRLGVGCSDPYGSGLNGSQSGLGPRWQVNANTGFFNYPHANGTTGATGNDIYKRLQVHNDDLNPALNSGAAYFVEGHYITPDDATAGNQDNNASYRQAFITGVPNSGAYSLSLSGAPTTVRKKPAIFAWKTADPAVRMTAIDVPGDGRLILGGKAWQSPGGGLWNYEYALHNLNCDRSVGGFSVPIPPGANITGVSFHDVTYHSGDGIGVQTYDGADWPSIVGSDEVAWDMVADFATDPNGNALRWGTLYNFRFQSDAPPVLNCDGLVSINIFKPGSPISVSAFTVVPSLCGLRGDIDGDGLITGADIQGYIDVRLGVAPASPCADLAPPLNGILNIFDDFKFIDALLGLPTPCQ